MKRKTLERIKNAARALEGKGVPFTQGDLAREARCNESIVSYAIKKGYLHFIPVGEQRDNYLLKELEKGEPLFEIARRVKYGLGMMHKRLYYLGLDLGDFQIPVDLPKENIYGIMRGLMRDKNDEISDIARCVVRGLRLERMGEKFGETRESVRQKIEALGLHDFWRGRKKRRPLASEHLREARKPILEVLEKRIAQMMANPEMPWAERKAYEYKLNFQRGLSDRAIPPERLVKLLSLYERVKKGGEKILAKDIAAFLGYTHPEDIFHILRRIRLAPFYREGINKLSKEKIKALESAVKLGFMGGADIAYFARLSRHTIYNYRGSKRHREELLKIFGNGQNRQVLSYRSASQIYQANDLGFSPDEAAFLCDVRPEVVSYALEHRKEIEPRIVWGIQAIYPDVKVRKPYIDFNPEEHRFKVVGKKAKG